MGSTTRDAGRVGRPKLPKSRILKKPRKGLRHANDGGRTAKSKTLARSSRGNVCPKCGSTDVFWTSGLPQIWSVWECRKCGYRGAFIIRKG